MQLGPYLIDEELAQGGMARVFRARLRGLYGFEKTLVLKQIREELARDPRFVEMFVREANTLVQLSHPHIVPVYELGAVEGTYYLSMEYIDGATVADILKDGPLGAALVAQLGLQVADALDYAHVRFSVLHRDVTPRNLIVDDAGHVRLLDFGIASNLVDGAPREGFGSPGYMAPEQVRGEALTPAADLFSLGAVLYEMLQGSAPFPKTKRGTLEAAPTLAGGAVPQVLAALIDQMLSPVAAARPQTAQEVGRRLRAWLVQGEPGGAFEALRERVQRVRARRVHGASSSSAMPPVAAPHEPIPTQGKGVRAIATSPVLTQMLRSAPGVAAPKPRPSLLAHGPARFDAAPDATRPVTGRISSAEASASRETPSGDRPLRAMGSSRLLRSWPWLAALAFALSAALVMLRSAPEPAVARPVAPLAPPEGSSPPVATPEPEPAPEQPASSGEQPAEPPENATAAASHEPVEGAAKPGAPKAEPLSAALSVSVVPWAEVSLDGKALGVTPLRKQRLAAGVHSLVLRCPPLGKTETLRFNVGRGAHARLFFDLGRDPSQRTLDGASQVY